MSLKRLICTTFFILVATCAISAQTESELVQALDKALATIDAQEAVIKAKDERIAAQDEVIGLLRLLREADQREKDALRAEADRLRAIKCNERTIAFKPLGWSLAKWTKKECY